MRAASAALLVFILFTAPLPAAVPPRPFHLELEVNPAAPFPFLSRFGKVTLHVYPAGVRAETLWLNGFSRNGSQTFTIVNPYSRMYSEQPLTQISTNLRKMSTLEPGILRATPVLAPVIAGNVRGIEARRYRLMYGPQAWIDIWTTTAIPETPQLRTLVREFARGISPPTAAVVDSVPGTPLYVEMNFRRYQKLPLLRMKSLSRDNAGEGDALKVGTLYFRAPMLDALWR